MAAPLGNNNASKENRMFNSSLKRSIAKGKGNANKLRKITDKLADEAVEGNIQAIKEVADRLDGKPAQAITGPTGEPIALVERVIIVQAIDKQEDNAPYIDGEVVQTGIESSDVPNPE